MGSPGRSVNRLNLDQWDSDVSYAFRMAMQRYARRAIQEESIRATLFKFMTTDMGKLIFQFRNFAARSCSPSSSSMVWYDDDIHTFQLVPDRHASGRPLLHRHAT